MNTKVLEPLLVHLSYYSTSSPLYPIVSIGPSTVPIGLWAFATERGSEITSPGPVSQEHVTLYTTGSKARPDRYFESSAHNPDDGQL